MDYSNERRGWERTRDFRDDRNVATRQNVKTRTLRTEGCGTRPEALASAYESEVWGASKKGKEKA
jgi:hypothetical protein